MGFQELGDLQGGVDRLAQAQGHGLQALEQGPGVEGAQGRTGVAHKVFDRAVDVVLRAQDRTTEDAALAVDVFGARVDGDVRAQIEAALQQRGGEDVVQHHLRARGMGEVGDRAHIGEGLHGVGGGLEEDGLGGDRQRLLPLVQVLAVDEDGFHAPPRQDLVGHYEARTEQAARRDQAVTGGQQRAQRGEHRRHTGRGGETGFRAVDQTQPLLEHGDRRVAVAGVDEVLDIAGERGLGRLGALVDETRIEEQRLGGLVEAGAPGAAAHRLGGGADALGKRFLERAAGDHDCLHGSPSARQPVLPR